ncbi:hypothetical protein L484_018144 [Morus notabilis]|uniref:Uncharacterized protein n=1 Tax=Morus notabilis TaxID=981085 RepID=W9RYD7_9ROSA|nr:hypothetical protein L484_018144 [Morus notabilis]
MHSDVRAFQGGEASRRPTLLRRRGLQTANPSKEERPHRKPTAQLRHDETLLMGAFQFSMEETQWQTTKEKGEVASETVIPTEPSLQPALEPIDDPIFIQVEDIESLKLILAKEEHFSCKSA